ncbi:MAG TPA: ATP-dependent DNA helicase RecG [Polyangia bacterium]|nr:ATP-dependent DNA helicase RecG [Polyangia bacterium]
MTYEEALDGFRRELTTAFADPTSPIDYGDQLVLAAAGVAEFIGAARKDILRGWARDIRRWKVLPKTERERLVAAGLRQCAQLATEKPIDKPAPRVKAGKLTATKVSATAPTTPTAITPTTPTTREGSVTLGTPLLGLPGVGPATAQKLADKGLHTVGDAVYFLPKRWDDLRQLVPLRALVAGQMAVTRGTVEKSRVAFGRGRRILDVTFVDDDGRRLGARWFYFRGGMRERFAVGARFIITGVPRVRKDALEMVHPETILEGGENDDVASGGVRVRYPEVEGVPGRTVEKLCRAAVTKYAGEVPDGIPAQLASELQLLSQADALRALHLPDPELAPELVRALNDGTAPPMRRLVFDEFFFLQLGLARRRGMARREAGLALTAASAPDRALRRFLTALPFAPTGAQARAIAEIARDLATPHPMHRLLQGDVGSGKTVVAFAACELACASGLQAAIMAPTEILAEQHARTLTGWAEATGRSIALLTASTPRQARDSALALLAAGKLDLVVGTHALLAERVTFAKLGVVVIDEQHRFGVAQRALLRDKGGMLHAGARAAPHLLVMTATPIPRTLALTAYGDLDLTILDELPPGREPPATKVLGGGTGRQRALKELRAALAAGRQAYWVCPLVEESEKLELQDVKIADVTEAADWLAAQLGDVPIGLVHGRLTTPDRDRVMRAFRSGELRVLVATTVIEVGVDVPAASMMVIEGAERFGLAQLHQLRGRIGRGGGRSTCLLLSAAKSGDAGDRLAVMAETTDGFKVAEEDLRIRGPGELFGTRQAGLPRLRYADLVRDIELLKLARDQAFRLLERDPQLAQPEHARTKLVLDARWSEARLFGEEAG